MSRETCLSGVERARREGFIHGASAGDVGCFGHLAAGLNEKNSRKLDPAIAKVLRAWSKAKPRFLELGPGSGAAVSHASLLVPETAIHTACVLTPINPYWRFSRNVLFGRRNSIAQEIQETGIDLDKLRARQIKTGFQFFEDVVNPYIQNQHIGEFHSFEPENDGYDIVYESCGPNWHSNSAEVCRRTFEYLREDGVLSMNSDPVATPDPTRIPFVIPTGSHTLFIGKDNFLAEALTEHQGRQRERVVDRTLLNSILDGLIERKKRQAR